MTPPFDAIGMISAHYPGRRAGSPACAV